MTGYARQRFRPPPRIPFDMSPALAAYHKENAESLAAEVQAHDRHAAAWEALGGRVPIDFPEDDPLRVAWQQASDDQARVRRTGQNELNDLAKDVDPAELARYRAVWREYYCQDENAWDPKEHLAPSGNYRLLVTTHPTRPESESYCRGRVTHEATGAVIAEVLRDTFSWIEGHPNGHDYLFCAEDWRRRTVIELDTGRRVDYLPKEDEQPYASWWGALTPSPDGLLIAVELAMWIYDVLIVDFSAPMNAPWPIIHQESSDSVTLLGWTSPTSCVLEAEYQARESDGKREDDLTAEEKAEMERLAAGGAQYQDLWETRHDKITWTKGESLPPAS